MPHPFDRYAAFTDLAALKEASEKPLRKSFRVNTLKTTVEKFREWAGKKGWAVRPVPWCAEGLFIERENREHALGKDLLHLLGHVYMQEAASMLPVELLDPQPGDVVLDMSAAPGSKTTQIAAKMRGKGVLVCNDVQEKRIWTLNSSLQRCGVVNAVVTRKVGQWFAKQMTERFDRVLCDAPCTAQGTSRKDSDALEYCSPDNIGKMAKLQRELLESAIHAAKIGGTIVYSTCTLTPEENEEVVAAMLQKFAGRVEVVDPLEKRLAVLRQAVQDSSVVQDDLQRQRGSAPSAQRLPLVRLWPHTHDTEGFFCAVLRKTASTRDKQFFEAVRFHEDLLAPGRTRELGSIFEKQFGTSFLREDEVLFQRNEHLLLSTDAVSRFKMPVVDYGVGLPFAKRLDDDRLRIDHDIATLRGTDAMKNICAVTRPQMDLLFDGKDAECPEDLRGDVILLFEGLPVGVGLAKEGKLKNRLPRWMVKKS